MTWSYNGPASSPKDEVRFLIGDTRAADPLLQDGEIEYLLAQASPPGVTAPTGNAIRLAAMHAAEAACGLLGRQVDETVGSVSIRFSQRLAGFEKTVARLKRQWAVFGAIPYAGGISISDKVAQQNDSDRFKPSFAVDMLQPQGEATDLSDSLTGADDNDDLGGYPGNTGGGTGTTPAPAPTPAPDPAAQLYTTPIAHTGGFLHIGVTDPIDGQTPGQPGDYYLNTVTGKVFGPST